MLPDSLLVFVPEDSSEMADVLVKNAFDQLQYESLQHGDDQKADEWFYIEFFLKHFKMGLVGRFLRRI